MASLLLRRIWFVAALSAIAGVTAFAIARNTQVVYERSGTFLLRPSSLISDAQIPDAIRGISQQDAQLVHTVARVIETDRFLRTSFVGAGSETDPDYRLSSSISPGSDVGSN